MTGWCSLMGEEVFQRGETARHSLVSHQRSCAHTYMLNKALVILTPPTFPKLSIAPRSTNQRMQVPTGRLIFFQSHRQRWAVADAGECGGSSSLAGGVEVGMSWKSTRDCLKSVAQAGALASQHCHFPESLLHVGSRGPLKDDTESCPRLCYLQPGHLGTP